MSRKQEKLFGAIAIGLGVMWLLNEIATNPRIPIFWRYVARTAEGDLYKHVISGELVTLLA